MDPHKILGIDQHATLEEIQRAYREKARKHHPDLGGDAWAFQQVRAAYEHLVEDGREKSGATVAPTNAGVRASNPSPTDRGDRPSPKPDGSGSHKGVSPQGGIRRQMPQRVMRGGALLWQIGFRQLPLQNETTYFIFANVLDIFVTYILVRFGGIEANPIARFFLDRWGFDGMIVFKMTMVALVAVLAQIIARRRLHTARRLLQFGTLVVAMVVAYGVMLFVRHFHAL